MAARRPARSRKTPAKPRKAKSAAPAKAAAGPEAGRQVRFAVVGLGYFAQAAVLPAFRNAPNAKLAALVSADPAKLKELGRKYGVGQLVDYEGYEELLRSGTIDAVYLTLPNDLHADFAVRAARAGVHVLTEKPMALTPHQCRRMITACARSGVALMVGYRLHFEPGNLAAIEEVHSGRIGEPRFFTSSFTMQVQPGNIRTRPEGEGGGPLYDLGIYCINAARYLFRAEPLTATAEAAAGTDRRFEGTQEQVSVILTFPGARLATFTASFGAANLSTYTVAGTKGTLTVENAYEWHSEIQHKVNVGGRASRRTFSRVDQVAPELMHFATCILTGREPEPNGKEGLIDLEIIQAIQRAIRTGRRQWIGTPQRTRRPSTRQEMRRPARPTPALVRAHSPQE